MGKRREQLNDFYSGMRALNKIRPEQIKGFNALLSSELKEGTLSIKTKELISVSIACYTRCEYCIVYHVYNALKNGATQEEIIEAALISTVFGGGPSMAYAATVLNECLEEFGDDFKKE
jgi:AhpD family alkylhydroperoxidase